MMGVDTVQIAQIIEAIDRLESRRNVDQKRRIAYVEEGNNLRVSIDTRYLSRFYLCVIYPLGEYRPKFDAAFDYGYGEIRAEILFEPA